MDSNNSTTNQSGIDRRQSLVNPALSQLNALTVSQSASSQQPTATQLSTLTGRQNQSGTTIPKSTQILTRICLALGTITIIGTIFTAVGLVSGLFSSNQGLAVASSLLIGTIYGGIKLYGTILCIITLIMLLRAKSRRNLSFKNQLIMTIGSLIAIYLPSMLLLFL